MEFTVPGAFVEHSPLRPTLTCTTALSHSSSRSSIFRTPQSQSAASSSLSKSFMRPPNHSRTGSELELYTSSRKRQRLEDRSGRATPDIKGYFSHSNYDMLNSPLDGSMEVGSPAPLVNIDYRLAGGMDTPRAWSDEQEQDNEQVLDYRMNRFDLASTMHDSEYNPRTPAALAREGNGRKRGFDVDDSARQREIGWDIGRTVWALTGGAALKVASFAWNTGKAFTGFRAGGGQAYKYQQSGFADQSWTAVKEDEKEDPFDEAFHGRRERNGTPIPGQFPDDRFIVDYMDDPGSYQQQNQQRDVSTPTLQGCDAQVSTSTLKSKNGESWILVQSLGGELRESSPTRRHKRPAGGGSVDLGYTSRPASRPASRASVAGLGHRPKLQPRASVPISTSNASFASPRAGVHSPAPLNDAMNSPSSFSPRHRHTPSRGHQRSRSSVTSASSAPIPISPDVLRFQRKARQKERQIDGSMRRLNEQLEGMIRQGREALGTKIEVCDTGDGSYEIDRVDVDDMNAYGDEDEGYGGSGSGR